MWWSEAISMAVSVALARLTAPTMKEKGFMERIQALRHTGLYGMDY